MNKQLEKAFSKSLIENFNGLNDLRWNPIENEVGSHIPDTWFSSRVSRHEGWVELKAIEASENPELTKEFKGTYLDHFTKGQQQFLRDCTCSAFLFVQVIWTGDSTPSYFLFKPNHFEMIIRMHPHQWRNLPEVIEWKQRNLDKYEHFHYFAFGKQRR